MAIINYISEISNLIPSTFKDFTKSLVSVVDDETIANNPLYAVLINKSTNSIIYVFRVVFLVIKVTGGYRLLLTNLSKETKSTVDFVKSNKEITLKEDWPFKNYGQGLYLDTFNGYKVYFCTDYDDMLELKRKLNVSIRATSEQTESEEKVVVTETVYI